jgi:hypothetical protein
MIRNGKIDIFANGVNVDKNLPKYTEEEKKNKLDLGEAVEGGVWMSGESNSVFRENDSQLDYLKYLNKNAPTIINRLKIWFYIKVYSGTFEHPLVKKTRPIDVVKFFEDIKLSVNELEQTKIDNILSKYKITLANAKMNNQISLIERLNEYAGLLKMELILSASEFNKYLTEEDIVNFHDKASIHDKFQTNLCLTYVKNFVKIIPNEISELRKKADELKVFDNYVILHYDPTGKAVEDTKEEKEKKKDPILFGVIKDSTKLYYIGDWIDDYCDLTLDVIIDKIGKEATVIDKDTITFE